MKICGHRLLIVEDEPLLRITMADALRKEGWAVDVAEDGVKSHVRRISVESGESETLTDAPGLIRSAFFLPDGRLAWTVLGDVEGETRAHDLGAHARMGPARSRIEVATSQGRVSTLLTVAGVVDRVAPEATGGGLYVRRYRVPASGFLVPQPEESAYVSLDGKEERAIT